MVQSHTAGVNNNPVGKGDRTSVYVQNSGLPANHWDCGGVVLEVMGEVMGILMELPNFRMKAIK